MSLRLHTAAALLLITARAALAETANPAREFLDGRRTAFSTAGHPKARGVNFKISYPSSWAASEGERPNIVQKFVSEGGRGFEMVMIVTKELPLAPGTAFTRQDQEQLFAPSELRQMLPPGARLISAQSTAIEGDPAGITEFTMRADRAGIPVLLHAWTLSFVQGHTFVQVSFQVAGVTGSEADVSRRMAAFKPLFTLIANSILFPDKWTTPPQSDAASPSGSPRGSSLPFEDPPLLVLTLLGSFVFTWGLGLTPPLVIRHAIVRHPLNRKTATWIAAAFSGFFFVAFQALNHALGEKSGTGVVWIILFFVARWIMSRGHVVTAQAIVESTPEGRG